MHALPVLLLLGAAAAIGLYMGQRHLRGARNRPMLIGVHLLLGIGGLEVMVMLLWGPDADPVGAGTRGAAGLATILLAAALFCGLLAPLIGRGSRRLMTAALATHAGIAAAGVVALLVWLSAA